MVIVLVLVISAVFMVSKRNESTSLTSSASGSPEKSDSTTLAAKMEKSGGPGVGDFYAGPSVPPTSTSSATPVPKAPALTVYIYPSSKTVSSTSSKLQLESTASPEVITLWYRKKIDESQFNAKSFAQTNTNGDILNKLTAAKPGEKLDITIKNDQKTSKVLITVDRS